MSQMLNLQAIEAATVANDPYPYFVVEQSISDDQVSAVLKDFPEIVKGGSFPLEEVGLRSQDGGAGQGAG